VYRLACSCAAGENSILFDNAFYVASGTSLYRTEFDGATTTVADYAALGVVGFHHNIDPGREGMILDVDTNYPIACANLEVDKDGNLLHMWNFADNHLRRDGGGWRSSTCFCDQGSE